MCWSLNQKYRNPERHKFRKKNPKRISWHTKKKKKELIKRKQITPKKNI